MEDREYGQHRIGSERTAMSTKPRTAYLNNSDTVKTALIRANILDLHPAMGVRYGIVPVNRMGLRLASEGYHQAKVEIG